MSPDATGAGSGDSPSVRGSFVVAPMAAAGFRILVVEENAGDAQVVGAALARAGDSASEVGAFEARVVLASDASAALATGAFDAVLLVATSASAAEFLQRLQARSATPPIVVVTPASALKACLRVLELGAEDVVTRDGLGPELLVRTLLYAIERRRARQGLYSSLKEKEILLHELQHRAKNNLQVISSLLKMQARRDEDPHFQDLVRAAQRRIEAIALAHDQLHRAPDLSRIDFSRYLSALARAVHLSYDGSSRGILLELSLAPCELPLSDAVPTGLLMNEILMNALKHAFPDGRRGTIRVVLTQAKGRLTLEVADDGVGMPKVIKQDTRCLGMDIVSTLAEQLDATFQHDSSAGTRFRLSFLRSEPA